MWMRIAERPGLRLNNPAFCVRTIGRLLSVNKVKYYIVKIITKTIFVVTVMENY